MAAANKEIVLITGANVGVGLEIARLLLRRHDDRFYVFIGCRTLSKGQAAVEELHDEGLPGCEVIQIEVTSDDSIAKAAKKVEEKFGKLDVLVVNAGIAPDKIMLPAGETISKIISETMNTNVAGAAQTAETFVPLLAQAENPRLIFISSGFGSLQRVSAFQSNKDWPAYSASKAALNMIMLWFWRRFPDWKVNAACPGLRATALNNYGQGAPPGVTPGKLENGALNAVRLALLDKDGETGTYTQYNDATGEYRTLPW